MRNQMRDRMRDRGIVLVAVLWIVAALSIIVTGIVQSVRSEVQLATRARQTASAAATGDAAIQLVLQSLVAGQDRSVGGLRVIDTVYQGTAIRVQVQPLNGLIDINNAPVTLLKSLFMVAGGLDAKNAELLAQSTADARSMKDKQGRPQGFEAIEDLLRVPGLGYALYAKLNKLVTADQTGGGRSNPMAAPDDVLVVLADGNKAYAATIAASRQVGGVGTDTTLLNSAHTDNGSTQRIRLQARVPLPDGSWVLTSRSVDLSGGTRDGLPWRTMQTDRIFESLRGKSN